MSYRRAPVINVLLGLGLFFLLACQGFDPQQQHVSALKTTKRFPIPAKEGAAGVDVWNAAAVQHPRLGWVALATVTKCYWQKCGPFNATARPWVAFLGQEVVPAPAKFSRSGRRWELAPASLRRPFSLCDAKLTSQYLIADFRPFLWKNTIWISHTIELQGHPQRMALSTLDTAAKALQLEQLFEKNLVGNLSGLSGQEKNWGFFTSRDRLMIQYQTLPCLMIFEYSAQSPRHAVQLVKRCYRDPEHQIKNYAFLDIASNVHNSCNPILWDKEGKGPNEYLVMVHNRYNTITPGYNHWLVRINAETYEITHISDGIVFGAAFHHSEGHFSNVIIVGSISLVKANDQQDLLILGGEGDTYAIHERINIDSVAWLSFQDLNIKADVQQ